MFSVISGFLYAAHRVDAASLKTFLHKKALRLLAPLLFLTLVMVALRRLTYGDTTSLQSALLFHYQHLWFLQALILIFVAVALWDSFARPGWVGLSVAAFAAAMLSRTFNLTSFLSFNGALYLAPFFLFGMLLRAQPEILQRRQLVVLACWMGAIVLVLSQMAGVGSGVPISRTSLPAALCGLAGSFAMLARCPRVALLEPVGRCSYTIYLWHSIAAAAVRHGLRSVVHLPTPVEFLVLLFAGLAVPIAIHLVVERLPLVSLLAAGIRQRKPISWTALRAIRRPATVRDPSNDGAQELCSRAA